MKIVKCKCGRVFGHGNINWLFTREAYEVFVECSKCQTKIVLDKRQAHYNSFDHDQAVKLTDHNGEMRFLLVKIED